ncbi:hypothetical protein NQ317_019806 [Molorchus minor]|uniref:acid phosphatase n=1 Tax=Molorchus minor TaxID=1323400 RepID=A0ABQ9JBY1_9CUCU|nr:hypothetical protein NQ317_019806 [Molorchus minor]
MFRHGDRAPSISFPNDYYFDEKFWPMGYGQLTNKGKARLYDLGKWLKERYKNFLHQNYSPKDVYIRSTNADRCLMSAASVLAGLYPPKSSQIWNPNLQWQPIPIHTVPLKYDEVLGMRKKCKNYMEFLDDIRVLLTVLESYSSYNQSFLPPWAKYLDKNKLIYLAAVAHERYTLNLELLTGPFWFNFFDYFDNAIDEVGGVPKFLMLSAHDTTIVSLVNGMGVYDFLPPVFGATLIWELKKNDDGMYVKVLYKRDGPKVDSLIVKGCEIDCNYEKFREIMEPVTVKSSQWEKECGSTGTIIVERPYF